MDTAMAEALDQQTLDLAKEIVTEAALRLRSCRAPILLMVASPADGRAVYVTRNLSDPAMRRRMASAVRRYFAAGAKASGMTRAGQPSRHRKARMGRSSSGAATGKHGRTTAGC